MNTKKYWVQRYEEERTGWDIGYPSTPLKSYIDQLADRSIRILIPGAGNAYEASYLHECGFTNVFIIDIADSVVESFLSSNPSFPKDHAIVGDFFEHEGNYDLILEQTFFCSFPPLPATRKKYAKKMSTLLNKGGKLRGVWFNFPLTGDMEKRPFGGSKELYLAFFEPYFAQVNMEDCYNSIPPRNGNELWGMFDL